MSAYEEEEPNVTNIQNIEDDDSDFTGPEAE